MPRKQVSSTGTNSRQQEHENNPSICTSAYLCHEGNSAKVGFPVVHAVKCDHAEIDKMGVEEQDVHAKGADAQHEAAGRNCEDDGLLHEQQQGSKCVVKAQSL